MLLCIDVGMILCAPAEIQIEFQLLLVRYCQQSNDDSTAVSYRILSSRDRFQSARVNNLRLIFTGGISN